VTVRLVGPRVGHSPVALQPDAFVFLSLNHVLQ
jgi:hypothetical protein